MNTTTPSIWRAEYSAETTARPDAIWQLLTDVAGWPRWNDGVESAVLAGPFVVGTELRLKRPGQDALSSRIAVVSENRLFVDETRIGDLLVRVSHRIADIHTDRRRVTYAVEAIGPGGDEVGPVLSADFPGVLRRLCQLAERRA